MRGRKPGQVFVPRGHNDQNQWEGTACGLYKPASDFSLDQRYQGGIKTHCKSCKMKANQNYFNTLRGNLTGMIHGAAKSASSRRKPLQRVCTLTLEEVLDMLHQQQGRCDYSRIKLECIQRNCD